MTAMTSDAAHEMVRARSEWCEIGCGERATDFAHRQSAAQQGPDVPSNALRLDRRCHAATEHRPTLAYLAGWRIRSGGEEPWLRLPALLAVPWPGWWIPADDGIYAPVDAEDLPSLVLDPTLTLTAARALLLGPAADYRAAMARYAPVPAPRSAT